MIAKAELHVHAEGSIPPSLVTKLANKNKLAIPSHIFGPNETYIWKDFLDFLKTYDIASNVLQSGDDYYAIIYDYLVRSAKTGAIYCELMISPDHARLCGIPYEDMLDGCVRAIDQARADTGIEGRLIITCVRHFGLDDCIKVAELAAKRSHPYIYTIGMGGDEVNFPNRLYAKPFHIAHEAGLLCTTHAGEMGGPESVWEAINYLPVKRIGHGVRSIEDPNLIAALIERDITLEVCPGSNIALRVYPDFASHPLRALQEAGVRTTLNSDDPPFFNTHLAHEYHLAEHTFGFNRHDLLQFTRNAILASFVDEKTKQQLLTKLG